MLLDQLKEILESLGYLKFEMVLGIGALIILGLGLLFRSTLFQKIFFVVILLVAGCFIPFSSDSMSLFGGAMSFATGSNILRLLMIVSSVWVVFYPTEGERSSEYYFLLLTMILGSSLMLSANNLLVIYLVIELASFSAYILTNFNFKKKSFEAGIKYLVFGGVTSAFALYGASLIYGFSGTLNLGEMSLLLSSNEDLLNAGIFLFVGSIFFKISAVPFHIWTPLVYQEAPTGSVMIMSIVPKIGGLFLLHRFLTIIGLSHQLWLYQAIAILGFVTIILGSLGALQQWNVKKMIAYGAIAHSGFLIAPLLISGEGGSSAFIWYLIGYTLINICLFYLISIFENKGLTQIKNLSGVGKNNPWLGVLTVIIMISLVGLPPTVGFTIKFYLFLELWQSYQEMSDPFILTYLLVGVLSVVFSLFFYLKIPYHMFFKDSKDLVRPNFSITHQVILTIFCAVLVWVFFRPEILNTIANNFIQTDW